MEKTILIFSLFISYSMAASVTNANYYNACLKCIINGNNFCMLAPETTPGYCCSGMAFATDYCNNVFTTCTYSLVGI